MHDILLTKPDQAAIEAMDKKRRGAKGCETAQQHDQAIKEAIALEGGRFRREIEFGPFKAVGRISCQFKAISQFGPFKSCRA